MTKFIACNENSMKEFESFEDALAFAKTMEKTAAVYMQTGTTCALVWEKREGSEDAERNA